MQYFPGRWTPWPGRNGRSSKARSRRRRRFREWHLCAARRQGQRRDSSIPTPPGPPDPHVSALNPHPAAALSTLTHARVRTDGSDDEEDEEGVEHGHDCRGQRRDDVAQGADSAEEADHAKRANGAEHVDGQRDGPEGDERQRDDDNVEHVPAVAYERVKPARRHPTDCGKATREKLYLPGQVGASLILSTMHQGKDP